MPHGSVRLKPSRTSPIRPGELPEFQEPEFTSFDQNPKGTWFRETEDGFEVGAFYGLRLEFWINLVLTLGFLGFAIWVSVGYGNEIEPKWLFFTLVGLPVLIAASFTVVGLRDVRVRQFGDRLLVSRGVYWIRRRKWLATKAVKGVRLTPRVYGPAGIFESILGKKYGRIQIAPTMAMNTDDESGEATPASGVNFSISLDTATEEIILSERLTPEQTFYLRFVLRTKMISYHQSLHTRT